MKQKPDLPKSQKRKQISQSLKKICRSEDIHSQEPQSTSCERIPGRSQILPKRLQKKPKMTKKFSSQAPDFHLAYKFILYQYQLLWVRKKLLLIEDSESCPSSTVRIKFYLSAICTSKLSISSISLSIFFRQFRRDLLASISSILFSVLANDHGLLGFSGAFFGILTFPALALLQLSALGTPSLFCASLGALFRSSSVLLPASEALAAVCAIWSACGLERNFLGCVASSARGMFFIAASASCSRTV